MHELKQLVFNLLENVPGITIPSVINRIIVDYYYLPSGASDILNQELNLYTLFKSQAKTFDFIWKVETFRIQFRNILEKIVNGNQSFHFSDFLLALPESKSYGQLTAHEIRFEGMICLEFSEFIRLYETCLPNYTALVRAFLQNILIFTENHDAITCSKDQLDFLLRLIQQYCSMPHRTSFFPFPSTELPSIIVANFFWDKVSTKYLSAKEPIAQRRQRLNLNYRHRELPNLNCFIFNNTGGYTFFIDRQNRSAIIELTEELPKQMAEWKAYQEQQAIQKWDFLHLLLLNTTSLPSSVIYIIINYQALSSIDFSEKITVEDILDAIKNDLRTLSETKPPRHMQLIALRHQEKRFSRSELTWLSDRIQKIKNINDYLLPVRTFIDLIAKEQSKAEESTLVEKPGLK